MRRVRVERDDARATGPSEAAGSADHDGTDRSGLARAQTLELVRLLSNAASSTATARRSIIA